MSRITSVSGTPASPFSLASHPHQNARCLRQGFDGGINCFFFYGPGNDEFNRGLQPLIKKHRDKVILATGCGGRKAASMLTSRRKLMKSLAADMFDVFLAEYISSMDDESVIFGPNGTLDELQNWKAAGWIRYAGATTHDRVLAKRLAEDGRVDVLMHRFNMAHRKAAREVFPAAVAHKTAVIAFTATRWGTLLEPRENVMGEPPTAGDCYRFCLTQRAVQIVLTAPRTRGELAENLHAMLQPRMTATERRKWERYGDAVYGQGTDAFETKWA